MFIRALIIARAISIPARSDPVASVSPVHAPNRHTFTQIRTHNYRLRIIYHPSKNGSVCESAHCSKQGWLWVAFANISPRLRSAMYWKVCGRLCVWQRHNMNSFTHTYTWRIQQKNFSFCFLFVLLWRHSKSASPVPPSKVEFFTNAVNPHDTPTIYKILYGACAVWKHLDGIIWPRSTHFHKMCVYVLLL